jgi:septum site-determining protein MinC
MFYKYMKSISKKGQPFVSSDIVSIKGTRNGLLILLDPNHEFEEIKRTLLSKMESARGFFKGAKFNLSQGEQEIPADQRAELENICRQFGLIPNTEKAASIKTDKIATIDTGISKPVRKISRSPAPSDIGEAALMVRRSLRSGQRVTHDSHIIVLGDVHPGAEVISGGNVVVIGGKRLSSEISKSMLNECQVARLSGHNFIFEKFQPGR